MSMPAQGNRRELSVDLSIVGGKTPHLTKAVLGRDAAHRGAQWVRIQQGSPHSLQPKQFDVLHG